MRLFSFERHPSNVQLLSHRSHFLKCVIGWPLMLAVLASSVFFSLSASADSLVASVDRTRISEQDTLNLTVTMEPRTSSDYPDFSVLKKDFQILRGPSTSSSTQWVNGDFSSKTQWSLVLLPLRKGRLTIPSFKVDGQVSDPINIDVSAMSGEVKKQTEQDAFFDIEVSQQPAYYVQGEILYTEKLYYRVNHQDASLSELQVEDARVEPLTDPRRYTSVINGERVGVYERQYVIYPEKAGTLVIPGQRFQALASRQSNPFDRWSTQQYMINAVTRPINLDIQPMPASYPAAPWLPARSLQLREQFSTDPHQWHVGEAITRTLTIETEGMSSRQIVLPELNVPDGMKSYPDQPDYQDTPSSEGIHGSFSQSLALVPTRPGKFTLPALRIAWWNLERNKLEFAELPAKDLEILPATSTSKKIAPSQPLGAFQSDASQSSGSNGIAQGTADTASAAGSSNAGSEHDGFSVWWLVATIVLLITNGISLWLLVKRDTVIKAVNQVVSSEPGLSSCWKELRKACQRNEAAAIRQQLLQWARLKWPDAGIMRLEQVIEMARSEQRASLQQQLTRLDAAIYQNSGDVVPIVDGNQIWNTLEAAFAEGTFASLRKAAAEDGLPELYPS